MTLKITEDVGAPALVAGVDLLTLEWQPTWNEWAAYILAGIGYVSAAMNVRSGGPFLKNMGIAALPLAARHIYGRVKAGVGQPANRRVGAGARMALQPINRGPVTRQYQEEFNQAGARAF